MRALFSIWILLLLVSCGTGQRPAHEVAEAAQPTPPSREYFRPPLPPAELDAAAQRTWLRDHFWEHLNLQDSTLAARLDSASLVEGFTFYVARVLGPDDSEGMARLMGRLKHDCGLLERFYRMAERWLHDPNSPLRSDELYIPVLEAVVESPCFDTLAKAVPQYDLRIARQNRVGQQANNFSFRLASGDRGSLYDLRAEYLLLFISNPGCPMCGQIQEELAASPMLSQLIEQRRLKLLMLYPDEELAEWHNHRSEVPASWLYAYDEGCTLREKQLYDLRAIPSLYLLNRSKQVLLKDVVDVALIEYTLDHQ